MREGEVPMRRLASYAIGTALLASTALAQPGVAAAATETQHGTRAIRAVAADDFFFSPDRIQIHRGDSIRWTNVGNVDHTTTSDAGLWNRLLHPGDTATIRFTRTGTFRYHCNIHPTQMRGAIRVVP
jgi:plastocyanin